MLRSLLDVALPQPQNFEAARCHVSVLRSIERHSPDLPRVGVREVGRVTVPVIAVELHHQGDLGDEGVDAEFAAYQVLPFVAHSDVVEHDISGLLQTVRLILDRLLEVHVDQLRPAIRISVSASHRAVSRVAVHAECWRFAECVAASLAAVRRLVAPLPFVRVLRPAEERRGDLYALAVEVDRRVADGAAPLRSCTSGRAPTVVPIALERAVFATRRHPLGDGRSARHARHGSQLVGCRFHGATLAQAASIFIHNLQGAEGTPLFSDEAA